MTDKPSMGPTALDANSLLDIWRVYEEIEQDIADSQGARHGLSAIHTYSMVYSAWDASFYHVLRAHRSVFHLHRGEEAREREQSWRAWQHVFARAADVLWQYREELLANLARTRRMHNSHELFTSYWIPDPLLGLVDLAQEVCVLPKEEVLHRLKEDWVHGQGHTILERLLTILPQPLFSKEIAHRVYLSNEGEPITVIFTEQEDGRFTWPVDPELDNVPLGILRVSLERAVFLATLFADSPGMLAGHLSLPLKSIHDRNMEGFAIPISACGFPEGLVFGLSPPSISRSLVGRFEDHVRKAAYRITDMKMHVLRDCVQRDYARTRDVARILLDHIHKVIPAVSVHLVDRAGKVVACKRLRTKNGSIAGRWYELTLDSGGVPSGRPDDAIARSVAHAYCRPVDVSSKKLELEAFPGMRARTALSIPMEPLGASGSIVALLPFRVPEQQQREASRFASDILRGLVTSSRTLAREAAGVRGQLLRFMKHEVCHRARDILEATELSDEVSGHAKVLLCLGATVGALGSREAVRVASALGSGQDAGTWRGLRELLLDYLDSLNARRCNICRARFSFTLADGEIEPDERADDRVALALVVLLTNAVVHHCHNRDLMGDLFGKAGARIELKPSTLSSGDFDVRCTSWYSRANADCISERLHDACTRMPPSLGPEMGLPSVRDIYRGTGFSILAAIVEDLTGEAASGSLHVTDTKVKSDLWEVSVSYVGPLTMEAHRHDR